MVPLVAGQITFEEKAPEFTGATVYVYLEDVTQADAASRVVATYVKRDVAFNPQTDKALPFTLVGDAPEARASYVVRVHIDLDGDGTVSRGDFISMQSHPVLTFGYPTEVSIPLRQIR